jgi:membrane protein DedA with SNARE-associated domain
MRAFIRYAAAPIFLLAVFGVLLAAYLAFDVPRGPELMEIARGYYARYGYPVVFLAAIAEGLLFINWYVPGSLVMVFGVLFARQAGLNPVVMVALIVGGFFVTSVLNYFVGRYGWYRVLLALGLKEPLHAMKRRVERHGHKAILVTYLHPNLGALAATCAGILGLAFDTFLIYSAIALIGWNALWGTVVYLAGPAILPFVNTGVLAIAVFAWLLVLGAKFMLRREAAVGAESGVPARGGISGNAVE